MVFIIRIRTSGGAKRLMFKDDSATWRDLQLQVEDLCGVAVGDQLLSEEPLSRPKYIEAQGTASLASLKLSHGQMLHLGGAASKTTAPSRPTSAAQARPHTAKTFRTSERCQHGPRGRCLECVPLDQPADAPETNKGRMTKLCNHGPGVNCLHCNQHVGDDKAELAEWLCNHATTTFCPKCLPPEDEDEEAKEEKRIWKNFRQFLHERKSINKSMMSSFTGEPDFPTFAGKKKCNRGHKPWPYGVCTFCAPPNANIRQQEYRHCDNISLHSQLIIAFYRHWMLSDPTKQKAAILFGTYHDEETKEGEIGDSRTAVHALYEPPQECQATGTRFLVDPNEKRIHEVATALGLAPVGWVITTQKREGKQYGGQLFLSGGEMRQAARFQWRYKDAAQRSRFSTVVIEHGEQVEPAAYQVSDQCVAMERDGLFERASDPYMLSVRKPEKGQLLPKVIFKDKAVQYGQDILPDEFVVKVITSAPKASDAFFAHSDFPTSGPDAVLFAALKTHLKKCGSEDYTRKLSDFNLLCYLSKLVPPEVMQKLCHSIRTKGDLDNQARGVLDSEFVRLGLFSF